MQMASSGTRAFLAGRTASHNHAHPSRSIHTPAFVARATAKPSSPTVQTIFRRARSLLSTVVTQSTTPGTFGRGAHIPAVGRSLYPPPTQARTIHQGLSLPVRYSIGRTLHSPQLPRPHPVPRNVTQVGLGTARNFSTGRPIFQSLADNVPVVGRAFWEADIHVKMMDERARIMTKKNTETKKAKRREMLKPRPVQQITPHTEAMHEEDAQKEELDHYFPQASEPEVTTYLLIPLAPTPTNRLPLRDTPHLHTSTHPLLPFSLLSSLHTDHATHTLRVSTIFARLDGSRVFDDPRVSCSAYGDPSGMCTILEVRFDGWSEHQVRSVLGEAGMGWCVMEEIRKEDEVEDQVAMEEILANMDTDAEAEKTGFSSPLTPSSPDHLEIDPSTSFVLPTLDFSASFPVQSNTWASPPPTPLDDLTFHNEWLSAIRRSEADELSDTGSDDVEWPHSRTPSSLDSLSRSSSLDSEGWMSLGFSSQFASRVVRSDADWSEPREHLF
ncbi:hypothetical protein EIP91_002622 [Steccherinum ochraceum]|uniref:Uncharacterized protein n=1 Tax=Steccherinum ochraceum TaxID=92696 RepID=A0A4R0RTL4_9APHY|nr:hypothetical protein EIP91_002622 [Steccherinum ochraceum]